MSRRKFCSIDQRETDPKTRTAAFVRVKVATKSGGSVATQKGFVWCGNHSAEEIVADIKRTVYDALSMGGED